MANIQVILTEALQGVGKIGDIVRVKAGFARNYLLPRSKALVATKANQEKFTADKARLEAESAKRRTEAEKVAESHKGFKLELTRHASETGQLYGSVKAKDIAAELTARGLKTEASQVLIGVALKDLGEHTVKVVLHPEVILSVPVTITRQTL
jgi:large subunit ribosomal protein L9